MTGLKVLSRTMMVWMIAIDIREVTVAVHVMSIILLHYAKKKTVHNAAVDI